MRLENNNKILFNSDTMKLNNNKFFYYPLILYIVIFLCFSCSNSKNDLSDSENPADDYNENLLETLPSRSDDYSKVWEDHFTDESINTNYWTVGTLRDPNSGDIVPGADGDHLLKDKYSGYVTVEDSYIEDGALVLRNQKRSYTGTSPSGNYNYTSGWAMTMHKVFLNKGYIEIRAQFPSGDKVWPALWLIAEDLVWGPEWDMFEYFGKNNVGNDVMGMHLLVDEWPNQKWDTGYIFNFDALYNCEAWHIYGFEWTEEKAVWTVDGEVKRELNRTDLSPNRIGKWPNEDMYIVINNEVQTNAPDTNTNWPNYLKIDYVEIYKKND